MNKARILSIVVTVLVFASVIAAYLQPPPLDVARAHAVTQGIAAENLALVSTNLSDGIVRASATVSFQVKGAVPPKNLVMELRRAVYFLPWEVAEYREEGRG